MPRKKLKQEVPGFATVADMLAWEAEQEAKARAEKNAKIAAGVSRFQQAKKKAQSAIKAMVRQEEKDALKDIQADEQ